MTEAAIQTRVSKAVADQLEPRWSRHLGTALAALTITILLGLSYYPAEVNNWTFLITDADNMVTFISDFLSPNFEDIDQIVLKMIETIQIALWGTVLSIIVGIPFGLLSSSNIAPQWVVQPVRRLMDAARAINELVFAILFVAAVGLGPFAGVMALFIHNLGIIAKLFSEAVEAIDPRPVEGDWCIPPAANHLRCHSTGSAALDQFLTLSFRDAGSLCDCTGYRRCRWRWLHLL